jgi:hypothetical protein
MRVGKHIALVLALLLSGAMAPISAERTIPRETVIPAGTTLRVVLENSVGSDISRVEDTVRGHLARAVVVDGRTIVPAGSAVTGSVTQAVRSAKVKGRARLGVRFHTLAVNGEANSGDERYRIQTATWSRVAPGTKKMDAAKIAVPATGGAIIGALVDGKKGAGIGALVGGGGGTAVVLTTRGKEVRLGRGAVLLIRLTSPVTVRS